MAKIYPAELEAQPSFHGSAGEKAVYQALLTLDDRYTIFYSFRWLNADGQARCEGEGDFIVLHPEHGILSIEVKDGGIDYDGGCWWQTNRRTGTRKRIDPFNQAAATQYRLQAILKERTPTIFTTVCRAVWFTSVDIGPTKNLPPEVVRDIILDQDALDAPDAALQRVFAYWRQHLNAYMRPWTSSQYQAILRALMPSLHFVESLTSIHRETDTDAILLTRQQANVLEFLQEQPTAAIHGLAGTGKTVLALERARRLASTGHPVLYLCFNEFLLTHLRAIAPIEHVTFHNVRTLAQELMQDDSIPIERVIPAFYEFFETTYDDSAWPWPDIVVDEGQDLSDSLIAHLADLAELYDGSFYVFYDREQYIMQQTRPAWMDTKAECRLVIYRNCRNTHEIADFISRLMGIPAERYENQIHGLPPTAFFYRDDERLVRRADQFVAQMLREGLAPEDIAILTIHSVKHSHLPLDAKLAGHALSLTPEPDKILFTSTRKFKGLEAKAVLLIDAETSRLDDPLIRRLLYVGASRAALCLEVAFYEDDADGKNRTTRKADEDALCVRLGLQNH